MKRLAKRVGILGHLFDRIVIAWIGSLTKGLTDPERDLQFQKNAEQWDTYKKYTMRNGYIEHQSALGAFSYGFSGKIMKKYAFSGHDVTAADNACEIIALYNALVSEEDPDLLTFPQMLRHFAAHGISSKGSFGTAPQALKRHLKHRGYTVTELFGRRMTELTLAELAHKNRTFIFSAWNVAGNPFRGIHTMCVTREGEEYLVHNDENGVRRADSLYEAVFGYHGGKGRPVLIYGIRK